MATDNNHFSLMALRILPQCAGYIRKCLKPDVFYYLDNTYEIISEGKEIKLRRDDVPPIGSSFFRIDDLVKPAISISAIVGKNGDGKSSIIELIIRLINNLACKRGLDPNAHLILAEDVCAELYYHLNGDFFCLKGEQLSADDYKTNIYRYKYNEYLKSYGERYPLTDEEIKTDFFYTLVSNYSHFAYNTEDFARESPFTDENMHWLQRVFHKNDAYQTPINLHPYRNRGNIDINRENLLSKQRILITVTKSLVKSGDGYKTEFELNGKMPVSLLLEDPGVSKLQKVTLKDYFNANKNVNLLIDEHRLLESYMESMDLTDRNVSQIVYISSLLTDLYKFLCSIQLQGSNGNLTALNWFESALEWMEDNGLTDAKSDISLILDQIKIINDRDRLIEADFHLNEILKNWEKLRKFSVIQIYRLVEILQICNYWVEKGIPLEIKGIYQNGKDVPTDERKVLKIKIDPPIIFKKYRCLSETERCQQYILYKTISIFETYPSYQSFLNKSKSLKAIERLLLKNDRSAGKDLESAFSKLGTDWVLKSHITLKLRQTYNFFSGPKPTKEIYPLKSSGNDRRSIPFKGLSKEAKDLMSDMETLPPAIFKWDIVFITEPNGEEVSFNTFSSGEKQKLLCQSAVIYHLQNINSIASESLHYSSVNIIFEEIELYFHPDWQRTFINEMMGLIRKANIKKIKNVNMLFVTHSPYILSDIPKSNVLFLKDGRPEYSMQENTFGANINSLLKNGFFLPHIPMGEFAYEKINSLFKRLNNNEVTEKNIDEIYAEIMTVGDPAIRGQLIMLFAPYQRLFLQPEEIDNLINRLQKLKGLQL